MKAIWKDTVIAESNETKIVENNHYFPMNSIKCEYFKPRKPIPVAHGKAKLHIMISKLTERLIKMLPGIIRRQAMLPNLLKTTWHSGKG